MAAAPPSPPQAPGCRRALAQALLLLAAAGSGNAQPLAPEPEAEPPPPEPPLVRLEPGWGTLQQTLGLPAWVDLDLEILAEPMANPVGGLVRQANWIQQTTLALTLRAPAGDAAAGEWKRWAMHLAIAAYNGDPTYAERLGAALPLQEVANPVGFWPTRASLERRSDDGRWSLEAGLVGMAPDLFSTPIEGFYVHDALNGAPVVFTIPNFPVFPVAAPGALLVLRPTPATTLRLASFNLAATDEVARLLGTASGLPPAGAGPTSCSGATRPHGSTAGWGPRSPPAARATASGSRAEPAPSRSRWSASFPEDCCSWRPMPGPGRTEAFTAAPPCPWPCPGASTTGSGPPPPRASTPPPIPRPATSAAVW